MLEFVLHAEVGVSVVLLLSFLVISLFLLAYNFYKDKYFQLYYYLTDHGDGVSTPSNIKKLALLGWGDGIENEFFTLEKLG